MNILFFDTETTGLPIDYKAPVENVNNWPRMVQLSWQLCDETSKVLNECDFIVKVDCDIPKSASRLHGITNEISQNNGIDLETILNSFFHYLDISSLLVGHNINFDKKILGAEFYRTSGFNPLSGRKKFCTMMSSTNYCKIAHSNGRGCKWPQLQELHEKLFGYRFDDAHNSLNDVRATSKCYFEMKRRGII